DSAGEEAVGPGEQAALGAGRRDGQAAVGAARAAEAAVRAAGTAEAALGAGRHAGQAAVGPARAAPRFAAALAERPRSHAGAAAVEPAERRAHRQPEQRWRRDDPPGGDRRCAGEDVDAAADSQGEGGRRAWLRPGADLGEELG